MKYINKICEWQLFSTCTQLIYENVGNIQKKINIFKVDKLLPPHSFTSGTALYTYI